MTGQRPLALMLGSAAHDRLHAALSLAAASAALGRVVAIYLHADAVRLLDPGLNWAEDVRFAAVGSPAIAELLGSAMELGVRITARSEEHTSELQSLMRTSYAGFCLKKKKEKNQI